MAFNQSEVAGRLRKRGESLFKDFVTGLPARSEIEFSAALAALHGWRRIDWKKVSLRSASESALDASVTADDLIAEDAAAFCEYPLFSVPGSAEEEKWGGFRADVLFLSPDQTRTACVENKVGAGIRTDMIAGTIECLERSSRLRRASFILLTGREFVEAKWYFGELREGLSKFGTERKKVSAHIMYWEDIFDACAAA